MQEESYWLKTELKKFIEGKMKSIKYKYATKFMQLKYDNDENENRFIELQTDKNLVEYIENEVKQDVSEFIDNYLMNNSYSRGSIENHVNNFVRQQLTELSKNDVIECIEDKITQFGDQLFEVKMKKVMNEMLKSSIEKQLKYQDHIFVEN